jgi:hypothetical protein
MEERLPGGINIFLFVRLGGQRLLSDQSTQQRQRRLALLSGDTVLPETRLLVLSKSSLSFCSSACAPRNLSAQLQFGSQQRLLTTLSVVKIFRQLVEQFGACWVFLLSAVHEWRVIASWSCYHLNFAAFVADKSQNQPARTLHMGGGLIGCLGATACEDQGCQQNGSSAWLSYEKMLTVPYCIQ